MTGIYKIENVVNKKLYIGKSIDVSRRLKEHFSKLCNNKHTNTYLQNAWNKYGEENFVFEILEICSSETLNSREIYWINFYKDRVYNLTKGGDGGDTFHGRSKESQNITIAKIKKINTGKFVSEKTRRRQAISKYGNTWNKGRKHSKETKEKISKNKLGKPRKQIKKRPLCSLETRQKISQANKGRKPPKMSQATRKLLSDKMKQNNPAIKRPVLQYDLNENLVAEYNSIKEAKLETGCLYIGDCCRGRQRTCGGYIWKYKVQCRKDK